MCRVMCLVMCHVMRRVMDRVMRRVMRYVTGHVRCRPPSHLTAHRFVQAQAQDRTKRGQNTLAH